MKDLLFYDIEVTPFDALVVFLGNFGPETPETLIAKYFDGPCMFVAAAEGDGDMINGRGDAYCGMLNCSYNLGMRKLKGYIPEYPVGTAEELADKIAEFIPIARAIIGVKNLKVITFGPRPQDFFACNAPIKGLYELGVEIEENSELDLLVSYKEHAGDKRIPAVCEEFLFRGVILAEYRALGQGNAVLISAICFAMLHFSVTNFPVYLFVGILLGVITNASRSVVPAMLLHVLSNALSVFTSDQFLNIIMQKNGAFFVGFLLAVLFGTALFLFLYCVELQYLRFAQEPPEQSLPPKNRTHLVKVFLSPTFLVLTAAFLLITALQ